MTNHFLSQDGTSNTGKSNFIVTPFNEIKIHGDISSPVMGSYSSQEQATDALKKVLSSPDKLVQFPK